MEVKTNFKILDRRFSQNQGPGDKEGPPRSRVSTRMVKISGNVWLRLTSHGIQRAYREPLPHVFFPVLLVIMFLGER